MVGGLLRVLAVLGTLTPLLARAPASAKDVGLVDGLRVMQKVEERYDGDDVQEDLLLTLTRTGSGADEPVATMDVRWLRRDFGKEDRLVVHFIRPKFAKGVTLLNVVKPYVDDERWVFFPEGPIIRRVHAQDEHSGFMGTDFSYYDLSDREPDEENHLLKGIEQFQRRDCYVVETTPKGHVGAGYSKKIYWVDAERFTKLRIRYFDSQGREWKQYDTEGWREIDGIWTPLKVSMVDRPRRHKTVIERTNVRYNQGPAKDFFQPQFVDCVLYRDGAFTLLPFEQRPTRVLESKGAAGVQPRPGGPPGAGPPRGSRDLSRPGR